MKLEQFAQVLHYRCEMVCVIRQFGHEPKIRELEAGSDITGKIAVGTTSLGPKIAAGSSPTRATKCEQTCVNDLNLASTIPCDSGRVAAVR